MSKENDRRHASRDKAHSLARSGDDAKAYASALNANYGFETECVRARFNYLLRHITRLKPTRILEVGCGLELFIDAVIRVGVQFERWTVIEPASVLAEQARMRVVTEPRLHVIEGFCEDPVVGKAVSELGPFDILLLSGVLHEVEAPLPFLQSALALVAAETPILVTTPNALSFHRLLAVEMGLITDPHEISWRNTQLKQGVVFDPDSLRTILEEGGVCDLQFDGYLFKPFTHTQMAQILDLLPPAANEGLERLGQKFPQNAAEIAYIGVKR
jgi:2-polyprenyl-3-methyl-5-hydroxy-6-metoxy-1,4-benzoquinol methylase